MSTFTDLSVDRYVGQNLQLKREYLLDPATHHRVNAMRQTLKVVELAMRDEGVDEDVRRRVVNRVVWGEPEGLVDVHDRVRAQVLAAFDVDARHVESWEAIAAAVVGRARPCEESSS